MNELNRMRYLDALGIENYVSRRQLPGAAPTRRLAIVRAEPAAPAVPEPPAAASRERAASAPPADLAAVFEGEARVVATPADRERESRPAKSGGQAQAVRFSLAAIFVGQIAWVETLEDRPLAREQVQLIHAMARAVSPDVGRPEVTQFDWPTHQNHQLDLGPEAALAGVAGFLQRQLEQRKCRGLVLLGEEAVKRVPLAQLGAVNAVVTASTLAMLQEPARKRQVWQDLQALVLRI